MLRESDVSKGKGKKIPGVKGGRFHFHPKETAAAPTHIWQRGVHLGKKASYDDHQDGNAHEKGDAAGNRCPEEKKGGWGGGGRDRGTTINFLISFPPAPAGGRGRGPHR